ncbi:hypothetical protein [Dyadobacter sp. CY323]|uniref:hypothetical protein n=1 Tax=Dyadobacter sp. CY323 TaxID=2907302 RepID=UPI001F3C02D2|nr:hypothetical protein [Dyadobacter sp. CY323]MCE6992932.1 hypothetical protein [Dyadobacter sp. CY323]
MSCAKNARRLANYIKTLDNGTFLEERNSAFEHDHLGALLVEIILQSGLNFRTVVEPRVNKVLKEFPNATTTSDFNEIINEHTLGRIINWNDDVKISRILAVLDYFVLHDIETCEDLKLYFQQYTNRSSFMVIKGIGPKTMDYLLKRLGYDTVAVDRHISGFLKLASIEVNGYEETKKIVEYAADFLEVSRSALDHSIWKLMSESSDHTRKNDQLVLEF